MVGEISGHILFNLVLDPHCLYPKQSVNRSAGRASIVVVIEKETLETSVHYLKWVRIVA
jgi:hypothetical protein